MLMLPSSTITPANCHAWVERTIKGLRRGGGRFPGKSLLVSIKDMNIPPIDKASTLPRFFEPLSKLSWPHLKELKSWFACLSDTSPIIGRGWKSPSLLSWCSVLLLWKFWSSSKKQNQNQPHIMYNTTVCPWQGQIKVTVWSVIPEKGTCPSPLVNAKRKHLTNN